MPRHSHDKDRIETGVFVGQRMWNYIPSERKECTSQNEFRRKMKILKRENFPCKFLHPPLANRLILVYVFRLIFLFLYNFFIYLFIFFCFVLFFIKISVQSWPTLLIKAVFCSYITKTIFMCFGSIYSFYWPTINEWAIMILILYWFFVSWLEAAVLRCS